MVWLVAALLLAWIAWGPVVLVVAAGLLCIPRLRWWVQDRTDLDRRTAGWVAGFVVALVGAVLVVPDGWLPIPPAPGVMAGPSYAGRPASARPVAAEVVTNPHVAAPDSTTRPGPLGLQPEVETSWLGLQRCGRILPTSRDALVALCTGRSGESLRVVDPASMRPTATRDLPAPGKGGCTTTGFYLDDADRAVVATADRQVVVVPTAPSGKDAEVDLTTELGWDLKPWIPYGDCVVDVVPDWPGRLWWVSRAGLVGTITPETGAVEVLDLDEAVAHGLAVDGQGVYVVTDAALHRLEAGADGVPRDAWRTETAGPSGSAPVLVDGGIVAVTDEDDDQLGVVFVARATGEGVCRQAVFEKGHGATGSDLAPVGSGVVVTNNDDYSSPRSTLLGFTSSPGIARVDLVDGGCVVQWTNEAASPGSGVTASWPQGLVYAWTKRPSFTGVSAWYLTAIDVASGRSMWSVRTGTGLLAGSDGSTITLGADGSAWLGTLAGLVRVRDRS
ncbi:hypothetical protein SAMN04489844_1160 [Nocardioides exalbidus]|uniref:PQQ-like domain-containing protein n=1 Tax=Nocardioides exalbidus TaxID=402596 RepID=A0A1H4MM83_9ACTN|nr:hypothetical protein [Nocardioides exalbidus]SEB83625.1 hypothetical protein SAMN04489844_1160 [Nocardioides exalbidus]